MNVLLVTVLVAASQKTDAFDSRNPEARQEILERNGGSRETEAAVERALAWLARNQKLDGTWSLEDREHALGLTSLALLAFTGTGQTPKTAPYGNEIRRGVQWILAQQAGDGLLGPVKEPKNIYGHVLGATLLAELAGMTGEETYRLSAQRAIDKLLALQNPGRGWRYDPARKDDDSSVTGWSLEALHTAEAAGLKSAPAAWEGAIRWFTSVTDAAGRVGYQRAGDKYYLIPGLGEPPDETLTRTAFSVLARWRRTEKREELLKDAGFRLVAHNPPQWTDRKLDYCYFHVASKALLTVDGPGGAEWTAWNQALVRLLLENQIQKGNDAGSWRPDDWWSRDGGRAYATAINALTLEVYYRTLARK